MTIGEASRLSGVSTKLIRHYETIGLIPKLTRTESGYRSLQQNNVQFLRFIKRSRSLGFSIKEIKKLLGLWQNKRRASKEVKDLAEQHIIELERKITELQEMSESLRKLSKNCRGDARPDCPIISGLEE